jgi:predicted PurR-regulated permease PerM
MTDPYVTGQLIGGFSEHAGSWIGVILIVIVYLIVFFLALKYQNLKKDNYIEEKDSYIKEKERQRKKELEELNKQSNSLMMWGLILIGIALFLSLNIIVGLLFIILGVLVGIYNKK